ncbi:MAG: NusA-like transcription termination signal-binding factor [Candidatus Thermoplasmatota archaeon]|nr:NusA-like transcription termination signal-binding factor [Candidatus Thermoplasmatota archaeon]MBS3789543.1 NusA-like transcription termination signal-binding factor [Candidatus Thermoplasmatota archaeon]
MAESVEDITFNEKTLRYISVFEKITDTEVVDCIDIPEKVIFLVSEGSIQKAIGKGGKNVTKISDAIDRNVHVIEFSEDAEKLLENIFYSYDVKDVEIENKNDVKHGTVEVAQENKARAIGKEGRNLSIARKIMMRHSDVSSVSVA